jgi:cell division GTPase FtsZ
VNILLLSLGGGGGNILRSVKALYQRDLAIAEHTDPEYAARLKHSVATRFADTNRYSLVDIPENERVLLGSATGRFMGARHDPEVARRAFEESRPEIERLISQYSTIIVIATGGKGTGTGTILPVTLLARQHKKLVIPIFVRPSFERHEVEKRRYDDALTITRQLDAAQVRFIEILNDRGYVDSHPEPQSVVWERMNVPVARALRGLLYVLWDLSQVDPSDLSALFAGHGRLRIGFSELDPAPGMDPSDDEVQSAVQSCWDNRFCNIREPIGTSLICIQGQWSNVADAKIKSLLAAQIGAADSAAYNPLYARAFHTPKPWGVTALFAEHTGHHEPLDINWSLEEGPSREPALPLIAELDLRYVEVDSATVERATADVELVRAAVESHPANPDDMDGVEPSAMIASFPTELACAQTRTFASFWDLALAMNRSDPAALGVAQNGSDADIPVDAAELKKLLGTVWFRTAFQRLSAAWRERLLTVVADAIVFPNHVLRVGRRDIYMRDASLPELKELFSKSSLTEAVHGDVRLLMAIGDLWGAESFRRLQFADKVCAPGPASKLTLMMQGLRR